MKKTLLLLMVLLVAITANAQIMNADLEHWDTNTSGRLYPRSWPLMENEWLYRDSIAQHGNYALQVSVWYYYGKTVAKQTAAVDKRMARLQGYYKYTLNRIKDNIADMVVTDTAFVNVWMTKWNVVTGERDTIGKGEIILEGSTTYQMFNCPIHYTSMGIPDTVAITFDPSILRRREGLFISQESDGVNSLLSIDNLSLEESPMEVISAEHGAGINIYPNPISGKLNILLPHHKEGTICLGAITGGILIEQPIQQTTNELDIALLPAGIYTIVIRDKDNRVITARQVVKQ